MNRRSRKWLLISGGIFPILAFLAYLSHGPSEAEKFKAQLRAKGEKINYEELGLTNVHGAPYMMRLKTFQASAGTGSIQPSDFDLMRFTGPRAVVVRWKDPMLPPSRSYSYQAKNPATDTWEDFSKQLEPLRDDLIYIQNLFTNPPTEIGMDYYNRTANWPFNYGAERTAAYWLLAAALNDLHFQHQDSALTNLLALIAFTHFHRNDGLLVNQMVHVAVGGLALNATWEFCQSDTWRDEDLAKMEGAWQSVSFGEMLECALVGERASVDAIYALANTNRSQFHKLFGIGRGSLPSRITQELAFSAWHAFFSVEDEMLAFTTAQHWVELIRLRDSKPWPMIKKEADDSTESFAAKFQGLQHLRYWLSEQIIPNCSKSMAVVNRQEVLRELTILAIALKRFHLRYGQYPQELNALVPQFLDAIPKDRMTLEPFRYHLNFDGSFTLYSAGEDGVDDGGVAFTVSTNGVGKKTFPRPITWGEGLDIVWPQPATAEEIASDRQKQLPTNKK